MNVMTDAKRSSRRPSGALIDAIVDNMRQNLEELKYATLAPSRYTVYLSQAEYTRLEGILPRLQAEAIRALNEELDKINRPNWLRRKAGWLPGRQRPAAENAGPRWHIEFLVDTDGELAAPGDIIVHSDLMLAPDPELGVGERTRRITTRFSSGSDTGQTGVRPGSDHVGKTPRWSDPGLTPPAPVLGRLTYTDNEGTHVFEIVRERTTIGRGGRAFAVDVKVVTSEDVSREHARIRRDAATGQFFLIDLSSLGTTLNGRHVPRGVEDRNGVKHENGTETALPARARIGLADTVFLEFEQAGQ
ncbi:MAG TPA: FHA domain-containing protein [Vicinamibacterales bacterium]|nr:FHA domain-containing protein [Vicinamibacterales bacterium]